MATRLPPKAMAKKLVRALRTQHPDYHYLKKVFQRARSWPSTRRRLPNGYPFSSPTRSWWRSTMRSGRRASSRTRSCSNCCSSQVCAMLNSSICVPPISICRPVRSTSRRGKAARIASCCFRPAFVGNSPNTWHSRGQHGATYLFESNRCQPYPTRRLRQIVKEYAQTAEIAKRVYPHLFRYQLITYLTRQGMISPRLQ
jgi:integrase/recombinase XerD